MKIGILGGTFDPIHVGHLHLAKNAKEQFNLDKVLFIPAFIPPHKLTQRTITPAPYRLEMVKRAIEAIPGFEISTVELDRADVSYTVDTLRELKLRYPQDEFFLIIGEDSFKDFLHWKEPDVIQELAHVLVAHRDGSPDLSLAKSSNVQWIDMALLPVSSTDLRRQLMTGPSAAKKWLPEAVLGYIQTKHLYQEK